MQDGSSAGVPGAGCKKIRDDDSVWSSALKLAERPCELTRPIRSSVDAQMSDSSDGPA